MNLRMKIVEQLMSSLFDDDREYLADCEDAALEIMKLIAAEQKPVESEGTIPGPKELAAKYRELMDQRRALIDSGTYSKVDALDEEIDSILNEPMLLTQSLLKDAPAESVDEPVRSIHVGVVCRNASGCPDVVFFHIDATRSQIADGWHFDTATDMASAHEYENPMIAFDEDDAIYPRLVSQHVPSSDKE